MDYVYDHNGNPTTYKGVSGYTYDAENRLTHSFAFWAAYNGDGLRVKTVSGTTTTYFLYDGTDLIGEFNATGNLQWLNTWGANGLVSRGNGLSANAHMFDPMGNVVNLPGGPANSTDAGYDAYGTGYGTPSAPYGYGGQWGYYTDGSGLVLCTHRYYDPQTGRWLTRDPIGPLGGTNIYGYVKANPTYWTDPLGLTTWYAGYGGGSGVPGARASGGGGIIWENHGLNPCSWSFALTGSGDASNFLGLEQSEGFTFSFSPDGTITPGPFSYATYGVDTPWCCVSISGPESGDSNFLDFLLNSADTFTVSTGSAGGGVYHGKGKGGNSKPFCLKSVFDPLFDAVDAQLKAFSRQIESEIRSRM